jgi:ubiquinone/menaquinone biosynthesis C-methylase UbiE
LHHVLEACWAEPLHDLGDGDAPLRGILAPAGARDAPRHGVTAQFLENAADYHRRYANVGHFRVLLDDALAKLDPPLAPARILDIGSGSGNSVIPLLDRFPGAFVVATDISPQLLAILRDHLATQPQYAGRYALVCVDAGRARYRADGFDLVVGAALLHHVPDPDGVLDACERALRPGGAAIFFEPFELGHAILHLAYRDTLAEAERRGDTSPGFAMLRQLYNDYVARLADGRDPRLLELDDKWMFTPAFFEAAARRGHWSECLVYPSHDTATPLRNETAVNLRLGMDLGEDALPPWAWERLTDYERAFSPRARGQLMFEGTVVMRMSPALRNRDIGQCGWWYDPAAPGRGFFIERHAGQASVVVCHYDEAGAPIWHVAGPAPLHDGVLRAHELVLRFETDDRARIEWNREHIAITTQHAGSPGWTGVGASGIGGAWIEDRAQAAIAAVIEDLGERAYGALLLPGGWCVSVASRRGADSFAGEWLRFSGGQASGGPYRAPGEPHRLGDARFIRTQNDRLVVQLPDGTHCVMRRGVPA